MTGRELEAIRTRMGFTQGKMAEALACGYVSYKRYATGSRAVPSYIARCAQLLDFIRSKDLLPEIIDTPTI